jgi:glycogen phosphorylase
MANLAVVGAHSINGVSALHSDLLRRRLLPDFAEMWPERFNNKTNGISQRRWLHMGNPGLAGLITNRIGDGWIRNLNELRRLEAFVHETDFLDQLKSVKQGNKVCLAKIIAENCHQTIDPQSLFDIQAKRIHEYKRQVLFVLAIIDEYLTICEERRYPAFPRTCVFAGKAAPGYWAARMIIKLINSAAEVINHDPQVKDMLKVVFIPDYKVSTAQKVIAAADLSEQLSTAGTEASGTGNMKFAMNGALTLGTRDGANIEMAEEIGEENIYIFGAGADEIARCKKLGDYEPRKIYLHDNRVRRVLDALRDGLMTPYEPDQFKWLYDSLLGTDPYFHVVDLPAYFEAREQISDDYADGREWGRKTLLNIARIGKFSSDRTIAEYACDIWKLPVQR